MKATDRNITYNHHSPGNSPQFTVAQGEEFIANTQLCNGDWLHSLSDTWSPEKSTATNPTVVVAVEGARPGDLLAVDILGIQPEPIGFTGFESRFPLANLIHPRDWGLNVKTVRIEDGAIHWGGGLTLPVRPMIGTLGTAPAFETLSNAKGGLHGGNMDIQEVAAGSTVYLPVEVDGALLHIGDVHAIQGDGEINGAGGVECRAAVRLRARILPRPDAYGCVRIEDDRFIMTAACERSVEESFYLAAQNLLLWMEADFGFSQQEAYLLMGQLMQARCTQYVNPTRSYLCKMPKEYLARPQ